MPSPNPHRDGFARRTMFGLSFVDAPSVRPVRDTILRGARSECGAVPLLVTPNTDIMVQYSRWENHDDREFFRNAWVTLPDGQPIVWASKILRTPLSARLCGSDLFVELWPELVDAKVPTVVVAPSAEVADGLASSHPAATTIVAPMIDLSDRRGVEAFAGEVAERVIADGATVLILCLGHPKDPIIAAATAGRLREAGVEVPYLLCLGGSAEFYLGIKKRAPRWVQRLSAEWLYRFAQEPRRLFHRYFVRDVAFVKLVASEAMTQRRAGRAT
ncbi:MAG: WecB/TagA/CpsF family glycosyltransferase [Actinobacteria bacterium]|nr:WecB/TagA/CpsF family glycosyltransferase [Actinomycetota bacterium]